jgi:hypothetical protein
VLFDLETYESGDTCRFVIHTNMSERTNEIKEHRHAYFMSTSPTTTYIFYDKCFGLYKKETERICLVDRQMKQLSYKISLILLTA